MPKITKLDKYAIYTLLETKDAAVARALVVLLENQTNDEQRTDSTRVHNGKGFRPCHAYMGTRMAKFFLQRGYLTPKQVAYWRAPQKNGKMKIAMYWRQLQESAERKALEAKVIVKDANVGA